MPYNYGGIDDSLLLSILIKGKAYSPDKFGLKEKIWKLIIEDELLPYREKIHISADGYFEQLQEYGFVKETKKPNFFYLSVHFSPYNRERTF